MKAKVIKRFIDLKENKEREIDEVFEVTEDRFKQINKNSYGPFISKIEVQNKSKENKKRGI